MSALALLVAAITLALAGLHAYWGFGGVWPGTDARSCARMVGGFRGIQAMPGPASCFAVTVALAATGLLALAEGGLIGLPLPAALTHLATLGAALVFLGRGIAGYTLAWRRHTPEEPFATLDRRWYSPLCLAIGGGLAALAWHGFAG